MSGKEATADLLVTAYEPNSRVSISTEAEGIKVDYHYRLSLQDEGTRLLWLCELKAAGLRRMMPMTRS